MSELIQKNDNRATIRWKLLTGVSALALAASTAPAMADDADQPTLWIEVGGNADMISGLGDRFTPPFTLLSPTPTPYLGGSPIELQKPQRYTFGGEATLSFQPDDSNWTFSAGIRYGRSNTKRDAHRQTNATIKFPNPAYEHIAALYPSYLPYFPSLVPTYTKYAPKFAEATSLRSERHLVLDFQAGKDVGLGMLGRNSSSVLSAGVRVARFNSHSQVLIHARPNADFYSKKFDNPFGVGPHATYTIYEPHWKSYDMHGSGDRHFNGIGPSLSWTGSVPVVGNVQSGELELDFGVNGAVLFGKQRTHIAHYTTAKEFKPKYNHHFTSPGGSSESDHYKQLYAPVNVQQVRSRSVTVPNLGANVGVTYRIENTKLSFGYRADYFFGAMDGGIDAVNKTTLGFNGLYASVSVGLGD